MATACGITATPLNVFLSATDALRYTGGRRDYLCRKCFTELLQEEARMCRAEHAQAVTEACTEGQPKHTLQLTD